MIRTPLIQRTSVLQMLLEAIEPVPAGVKLSIPLLRDALISQADVLAGIETLILAGEIEAATLRPPLKAAKPPPPPGLRRGQSADGEPSQPLFEALKAEGGRRGLSMQAISLAVFGNKAGIYYLMRPGATARKKTVERIRAWIAEQPKSDPPSDEQPPLVAAPPNPTGRGRTAVDEGAGAAESNVRTTPFTGRCRMPDMAPAPHSVPVNCVAAGPGLDEIAPWQLHRDILAFMARFKVTATAFGKAVNGDPALVKAIGDGRQPQRKTLAKIRAIIADPPAWLTARPLGDRRISETRRDATQKPETPLTDLADRQRANGQRNSASMRRGQEQEAAALVDRGVDPSKVKSSFQGTLMRQIIARRAEESRQADPVEQAKLALQQKGRTVYASSVVGGPQNRFVVSGMGTAVTPAAMIAEAERVTGKSFRRSAS